MYSFLQQHLTFSTVGTYTHTPKLVVAGFFAAASNKFQCPLFAQRKPYCYCASMLPFPIQFKDGVAWLAIYINYASGFINSKKSFLGSINSPEWFYFNFSCYSCHPSRFTDSPQPAVSNQLGTGVYRRTRKSILGLHCYIFSTLQKSAKFDLGFSRVKTHTHTFLLKQQALAHLRLLATSDCNLCLETKNRKQI